MYENKKISKITEEVLTYLLNRNATNIEFVIEKKEDYTIVQSTSQNVELTQVELKDLQNFLNCTHREAEIEEYYWQLAGQGMCSEEMGLVAVMVDFAEIYYEGKELKMDFLRKKNDK